MIAMGLLGACADRFSAQSFGDDEDDGVPPFHGEATPRAGWGLVSAAPATDEVALRWRTPAAVTTSFGLFVGTDQATLFDGPPALVDPPGNAARVGGLTPGVVAYAGLAVDDGGDWRRVGPVFTLRPRTIVYVDPNAVPGGDGSTPGQAFDDLFVGILTAFALGGGNVWVAEGAFAGVSISIPDGVDVYGGFPADFDLDQRDPATRRTTLQGSAGEDILVLELGSEVQILDGLAFDGAAGAKNGVDVDETPVELRALVLDGTERGVRLRQTTGGLIEADVTACTFTGCELEGLSSQGAFELEVDGCVFVGCGQEGLDLEDLIAPDGETVALRVRQSVFAGCGEEGLDCDLAAPAFGGVGGVFEVELVECDFVENELSGLLVDVDYETAPLWSSVIRVAGCVARRNGTSGIALDLDARADVLVQRVACYGNATDGLLVTSESFDGVVQVDASLFLGNAGRGVRSSLGNFAVLVANSVFAGNHGGGMLASAVEGSAVSSVAYQQPNPYQKVLAHVSTDVAAGDPRAFQNAPMELLPVVARDGVTVTVAGAPAFGAGTPCELDGDDVEREAVAVVGSDVTLDDAAGLTGVPATLAAFSFGAGVVEDWAPSPASVLLGAGLPAPSGAPTDAGPFGAAFGGAPGALPTIDEPSAFLLARITPHLGLPLDPMESITLRFAGGSVAAASLGDGVSVVDAAGAPVAAAFAVDGSGYLNAFPPPGGWTAGSVLRLHRGLSAVGGAPLAAEVALPLRVP